MKGWDYYKLYGENYPAWYISTPDYTGTGHGNDIYRNNPLYSYNKCRNHDKWIKEAVEVFRDTNVMLSLRYTCNTDWHIVIRSPIVVHSHQYRTRCFSEEIKLIRSTVNLPTSTTFSDLSIARLYGRCTQCRYTTVGMIESNTYDPSNNKQQTLVDSRGKSYMILIHG